jgi:putative membrane protein
MVHPAVWVCLNLDHMKQLLMLSFLCFGGLAAKAQIPQPDPDTTARHFLIVASIKNLQEVSAGEQAIQKAKQPEVRAFAQMMIKDHGQSEQQLLTLAKSRGINLPPAATGGIKPDPLLAGAANFDAAYVHAMSAGHGNTVQMFENYATTGKDPAVRAWAQQMLPTLKMHLEHIKTIEKQLK